MMPLDREERRRPGKLWSLWDLMKRFPFQEALEAYSGLTHVGKAITPYIEGDSAIPPDAAASLVLRVAALSGLLKEIGLNVSADHADTLVADLNGGARAQRLNESFLMVWRTVPTEAKTVVAVQIAPDLIRYHKDYTHSPNFPAATVFPGTEEDMEEAGNCLALSQGTACVFHLMRAMETMVADLGRKLGATTIDKNGKDLEWGKIIGSMNNRIEAMERGYERDRWSHTIVLLSYIKNVWRNPTMHPKQTYTPDQAKQVYDAVCSFSGYLVELRSPPDAAN